MLIGNNSDLLALYGSPDDNLNNGVTRHLLMSVAKLIFVTLMRIFWILFWCAVLEILSTTQLEAGS